ncbi:uncharacterized protein J2Z79_002684 [Symbiobacterium terraclitae]|uniref:DUF177 domain-containing protein n=1 Tax=Symbiobacterium terraclitae TaxID=557451 RepID=A0ABS4JUP3_9FIRM|nr:uncharacterized protein [Symbiobacterium terraclitae]
MRIDVSDIKEETGLHKRIDLSVSLQPIEFGGQEARFDRPFTGTAEIWNLGDRLLVQAALTGEAELSCGRCLGRYREPVEVSFDEEFVEGEPGEGEPAVQEDEDSGRTVSFYTGDEIDLTDPLRDNILLALPMKPLCSEDCQGLCPNCGADLNEGPCGCGRSDERVDPRLAVLKDLLRKPDSQS